MKHLFIINPVAGKGKTSLLIPKIKKAFQNSNDIYFIEVTDRPGHATEIVKRYVGTDRFRVYSVGGDGTLNEVLNGLVGSGSSLAVIPGGSGNDFIRSIIGNHHDSSLLEKTIRGTEALVDLGCANGKYFINISSLGFDAEVVLNANRFKKIPGVSGPLAYLLSIIYSVFRSRSKRLQIEMDGRAMEMKSLLIAVANGKYYGGGLQPTPEAKINDGLFDLCLVRDVLRIKILSFFPKIIRGHHGELKEVSFDKAKKVRVVSEADIPLNIDGEVSKVKEVSFEIIPRGIQIVIPESYKIG